MGRKHKPRRAKGKNQPPSPRLDWRSFLIGAVVSAVVGLPIYVLGAPWLVSLFPGPTVTVFYQRMIPPQSSNAEGCQLYRYSFESNQPLEYMHFSIQFPRNIADYRVNPGREDFFLPGPGEMTATVMAVGKNPDGECVLKANKEQQDSNLNVRRAGPGMIEGHVAQTSANWNLSIVAVMSRKVPSFRPGILHNGGDYEYAKFGQIIRKPLKFRDLGTARLHRKSPD